MRSSSREINSGEPRRRRALQHGPMRQEGRNTRPRPCAMSRTKKDAVLGALIRGVLADSIGKSIVTRQVSDPQPRAGKEPPYERRSPMS